jgi:DNA phosphorothioation-dependent restriction protein DptG
MVRERNREIEAIINKLGDETHDTQKQLLTQYERKVKDVEAKWKADVEDYKATIKQWKDKLVQEEESRHMLDDNLRVLSRRINDLELDI